MKISDVFSTLPDKLRAELITEFTELSTNFAEAKWRASGLNAGRFCEIAYCILKGRAEAAYPAETKKPSDLPGKLRSLESDSRLSHGLRQVATRILGSLFEIRNHRNISHVGGVDPSFMDASFVMAGVKWVMAEFVREFHDVSSNLAQSMVDTLSQYSPPSVWADASVRRVLDNSYTYDEKIVMLLTSTGGQADRDDVFSWLDQGTRKYFNSRIVGLHDKRQVEAKAYANNLKLLPPGIARSAKIFAKTAADR